MPARIWPRTTVPARASYANERDHAAARARWLVNVPPGRRPKPLHDPVKPHLGDDAWALYKREKLRDCAYPVLVEIVAFGAHRKPLHPLYFTPAYKGREVYVPPRREAARMAAVWRIGELLGASRMVIGAGCDDLRSLVEQRSIPNWHGWPGYGVRLLRYSIAFRKRRVTVGIAAWRDAREGEEVPVPAGLAIWTTEPEAVLLDAAAHAAVRDHATDGRGEVPADLGLRAGGDDSRPAEVGRNGRAVVGDPTCVVG